MKNKTIFAAILIVLMSSLFTLAPVNASGLNLPTDPVTVVFTWGPLYPIEERLPGTATLSDVPPGYDVTNGPYTAYCIELGVYIVEGTPYSAILTCINELGSTGNSINWLLNNYPDNLDAQMAIWLLLGYSEAFIIAQGWPFTGTANNMYLEALTHGDFTPSAGDKIGIRCTIDTYQDLMIYVELPDEEFEGLTPGFWKNHLDAWVGYSPEDHWMDYFEDNITIRIRKATISNPTLLEALMATGGINETIGVYDALARHAVAALLNAAHPDIDYPLTEAEIISQVNEVIGNADHTDAEPLKDTLDSYNNLEM
ncbi:MAG: hypothetical protein ACFE7A_05185 [Promethearchaeota archaeon]